MIGGGHRTDADSRKRRPTGPSHNGSAGGPDDVQGQQDQSGSRSALAVASLAGIVALAAAGIAVRDAGEPNVRSLGPGDDFATRHAPPELVLTWADDYAHASVRRCRLGTNDDYGTRRSAAVELGTNDDYGTRRSATVELGTNDDYGTRRSATVELGTDDDDGIRLGR